MNKPLFTMSKHQTSTRERMPYRESVAHSHHPLTTCTPPQVIKQGFVESGTHVSYTAGLQEGS